MANNNMIRDLTPPPPKKNHANTPVLLNVPHAMQIHKHDTSQTDICGKLVTFEAVFCFAHSARVSYHFDNKQHYIP